MPCRKGWQCLDSILDVAQALKPFGRHLSSVIVALHAQVVVAPLAVHPRDRSIAPLPYLPPGPHYYLPNGALKQDIGSIVIVELVGGQEEARGEMVFPFPCNNFVELAKHESHLLCRHPSRRIVVFV